MNNKPILKEKTFSLGLNVIAICKILKEKKNQSILYNQFLRSGTAVGALVREAEFAQSKADFISKMSIALKEANETNYWLMLFHQSGIIDNWTFSISSSLSEEIIRMLVASVKTAKNNGLAGN
jgi:four helix bundle protein